MTQTQHSLTALLAYLRNEPFEGADWMHVVALANRCWLGPTLSAAVARLPAESVPQDVRSYLGFLYDLNRQRNMKLRTQLVEVGGALNSFGIRATLLKGSVPIFMADDKSLGDRMTTDLDLGIEAGETARARSVLLELGYTDAEGTRGMGRPSDAGLVELRDAPSGLTRAYFPNPSIDPPSIVSRSGVHMRLQSATARAHHWIVHDMIKEGDYVRGRIDLRHLYDLAETCRVSRWRRLAADLVRHAKFIRTQCGCDTANDFACPVQCRGAQDAAFDKVTLAALASSVCCDAPGRGPPDDACG